MTSTSFVPCPPTTAREAAARTVQLTKVYGHGSAAVTALDAVDVAIPAGEFTAIMGPSGSGKSTLMHCLAGLDSPTSGEVWLGDTETSRLSDRDLTLLRRRRMGFVFQSFNLLPVLTAAQNISLPMKLAGKRPDAEWFDHVTEILGIRDRLSHRPTELSGGQQQRVAVARALMSRPAVLFADEPTGALDSQSSTEMLSFLRRSVRELDQTVVMVTHDKDAASYAGNLITISDGRVAS